MLFRSIYGDLSLPLALLVDPDSRMVAVHLGPPEVDVIVDQVRRLQQGDPRDGGRWTHALTGGRWLGPGPARNFERAIEYLLEERKEEAFAAELRAFVDAR